MCLYIVMAAFHRSKTASFARTFFDQSLYENQIARIKVILKAKTTINIIISNIPIIIRQPLRSFPSTLHFRSSGQVRCLYKYGRHPISL